MVLFIFSTVLVDHRLVNQALGITGWLLPVAVVRLHVGDLHAVGWGP